MADATWTHWSRFKELRVTYAKAGVADSVELQNWKDTYFLSLGTQYKFYKDWKATLGVAYDQSPVKDLYRSPRLPDQDRYWVAVGVGYSPTEWCDLNLSYAHIFSKKTTVNMRAVGAAQSDAINLTTTPKVDIIGIQASFKF
jgi:long-chain fatty acid transport protein